MKLVKYKNGKYGAVKRNWLFGETRYLDLRITESYWWIGDKYLTKYCQGTEKEAMDAIERNDSSFKVVRKL